MKAVRVYGPCLIRIEDIPLQKLKENEALIRVKSISLCGTDYEIYTNNLAYIKDGISRLPLIPGHEWSGVVEKIGPAVTKFHIGDKVVGECTINCGKCKYCLKGEYNICENRTETGIINKDGACAEYIIFPESHLHRFSTLSFDEAALIEPTAVALYALMRGNIVPQHNVLVTGPGPLGLQVAQIAKKVFGAKKVILSGTRDERLIRGEAFGLDGTINIRKERMDKKILEITNGQKIDVVIEASGSNTVFEEIKSIINPLGKIVTAGFFGGEISLDIDFFTMRNISLIGALGSPNVWKYVIELMESGKIEARSLISHKLKLEEFEKGLDIMVQRTENACKIVLNP